MRFGIAGAWTFASSGSSALLSQADPPPARVLNAGGGAAFLIVCDHAGRQVPQSLGRLGAPEPAFERHIAWDIGAAGVSERLAASLDACAVLQSFSRLVIDCNRGPGAADLIPVESGRGRRSPATLASATAERHARAGGDLRALSRGRSPPSSTRGRTRGRRWSRCTASRRRWARRSGRGDSGCCTPSDSPLSKADAGAAEAGGGAARAATTSPTRWTARTTRCRATPAQGPGLPRAGDPAGPDRGRRGPGAGGRPARAPAAAGAERGEFRTA